MNTAYWDLFWTTGLPEAWLMSRDREGAPKSAAPRAERAKGAAGPTAGAQPGPVGGVSAAPRG